MSCLGTCAEAVIHMRGEDSIHGKVLYVEVERRKGSAAQQSDLFSVAVDFLPKTSTAITESVNKYCDEQKGLGVYTG